MILLGSGVTIYVTDFAMNECQSGLNVFLSPCQARLVPVSASGTPLLWEIYNRTASGRSSRGKGLIGSRTARRDLQRSGCVNLSHYVFSCICFDRSLVNLDVCRGGVDISMLSGVKTLSAWFFHMTAVIVVIFLDMLEASEVVLKCKKTKKLSPFRFPKRFGSVYRFGRTRWVRYTNSA